MKRHLRPKDLYAIDSILTRNIPICREDDTFAHIMTVLVEKKYDAINYVFIVDKNKKLKGVVDLTSVIKARADSEAKDLMQRLEPVLSVEDSRDEALMLSLEHDMDIIPVCSKSGEFIGAVTSRILIDLMHQRHFETALLLSGSQKRHESLGKAVSLGFFSYVKNRAYWLTAGVIVGLLLGLISSLFESSLKNSIALAYFIPVVAYIANSVGTQSEALTIRALATIKINYFKYLIREFFAGMCLGVVVGLVGGIGAFFIAGSLQIAIVVAISLFVASSFASVFASLIPVVSKVYGIDPAISSGPVSTAIQDLVSVLPYFLFAVVLL